MRDLKKRLDLDIDGLLNSPKLKMQLSPAELDKQLLGLYNSVVEGPSGDLLRIIGGGNDVALQHRYMKRKSLKDLKEARLKNATAPFYVDNSSANTDEQARTTSQWVQWTMRKNLPTNGTFTVPPKQVPDDTNIQDNGAARKSEETSLSMCSPRQGPRLHSPGSLGSRPSWGGVSVFQQQSQWTRYSRSLASTRSARGLSLLI